MTYITWDLASSLEGSSTAIGNHLLTISRDLKDQTSAIAGTVKEKYSLSIKKGYDCFLDKWVFHLDY